MPGKTTSIRQLSEATHQHQVTRLVAQEPTTWVQQADLTILQRAAADPHRARPSDILAVQRVAGNRAATHLIQTKLTVGLVGDHQKMETDRVARKEDAPQSSGVWSAFLRRVFPTEYVVQPRDTLHKIATQFRVETRDLRATNAAKLRAWTTPRGKVLGFNTGERILVPPAKAPTTTGAPREKHKEDTTGPVKGIIEGVVGAVRGVLGAGDPEEVIKRHNKLGTFGQGIVARVTSKKRTPKKQLDILRDKCRPNKGKLDDSADKTPWLKGELDWKAFETCAVSDEGVWLPFFFALYWAGGKQGPRTLPLVASPVDTEWKKKNMQAHSSPHCRGKAMDVTGGNLETLATIIKPGIPEFRETGQFPVRSTQIENVKGQHCVHVNFKNVVY